MTRLVPDTPEFPLIWRFDIPPATNKLQWQPPTTAEYRRQKNQLPSSTRLATSLIAWLKRLALDSDADVSAVKDESVQTQEEAEAARTITKAEAVRTTTQAEAVQGIATAEAGQTAADVEPIQTTAQAEAIQTTTEDEAVRAFAEAEVVKTLADAEPLQASTQAEAAQTIAEAGAMPMTVTSTTGFPEEIALLRRAVCRKQTRIMTAKLFRLCRACQLSIWDRVKRGQLSVSVVQHLLDPLDRATRDRIPATVADSMVFMIRSTVIRAMGKIQEQEQEDKRSISWDLWLAVAERICAVKQDVHVLFLFNRLMCLMPVSLRSQIPPTPIAELGLLLIAAQAEQCLVSGRRLHQMVKFNEALSKLTETRRQEVYDMMRNSVLQQHRGLRLCFSWLLLKALDSHTSDSDFILDYRAVTKPGTRLDSLQLWHLAAARLLVAGALPPGQTISTMPSMPMSRRWTILIRVLLPLDDNQRQLRNLCSLLAGIDGFQTMAQAIANLPHGDMPMDDAQLNMVLTVTRACGHHNLALALFDAFLLRRRSRYQLAAWSWSLWAEHVEAIIKDSSINPRWAWRVLGHVTRCDDACPVAAASEVEAKVKLLIKMSRWFLGAAHLTDRQKLRELTRCLKYQRKLMDRIASSTLLGLTNVITRDLQRGEQGRQTRIDWLLDLTEEAHGVGEAERTAAVLEKWRSVNRERVPPLEMMA